MNSKKMFAHEAMLGMQPKHRVPVRTDSEKYNPEFHTQWFEDSDYLAVALQGIPYATYKTNSTNLMSELLENGYSDGSGTVWTPFFAFWKDQEGRAFLAPKNEQVDLAMLGIHATLKTTGDILKFDKYLNRLFAALPKKLLGESEPAWGIEIGWDESVQVSLVQIDEVQGTDLTAEDRQLTVRFVDLDALTKEQKALVDGCMVFSDKACRALNLTNQPTLGMAWRGTISTPRGLGKGHILYKSGMIVDIVIYGPKKLLTTDRFFFGSMGPLHTGDPHTDPQSFINFGYHRPGLAVSLAKQYMREVVDASKDEDKLRRLFLRQTKDIEHSDMDPQEWVLRNALANGVSFLRFPGLYRRVINFLMKEANHCYQRARIPLQSETYSKAMYGYVLPDIAVIDGEGNIHPELGINSGCIVFPDLKPGTKVVCYRQPNENSNAWVPLTVVSRPGYERFAGRGICMLGRGADKVLHRLGGGDMDDSFVIIHDPVWVEAFHSLKPYPETFKITEDQDDDPFISREDMELEAFTEECLEDIQEDDMSAYCHKHVQIQMDMSKKSRANIGPVVNFGMDDMLKSDPDHLNSMLADLKDRPEEMEWLLNRTPWQAAELMSNLERVIDGNVKDATLLIPLGDVANQIAKYHKAQKVYPKCFAGNALDVVAGRVPVTQFRSRIPKKLALKGNFIVVRSLTCRALEQIEALATRLQDVFIEREWALVAPADYSFRPRGVPFSSLPYGYEKEIKKLVKGLWIKDENDEWVPQEEDQETPLMDMWIQEWKKQFAREEMDGDIYQHICGLIEKQIEDCDDYMRERIAVEIYYQTYKAYQPSGPKTRLDGSLKHYQDALLWSPVFGNHFINALRKEELSGSYKMASFRHEFSKVLMDKAVAVKVVRRQVYIQGADGKFTVWVGYVYGCPNGMYRLDDGLIQVKAPENICLPVDDGLIPAQRPLVRIFRERGEPALVIPKEEEATGFFGKLMAKAFSILK